MNHDGNEDDKPSERKGRQDRRHARESLVLRAVAVFDEGMPISCGLIDISVGGARLKSDYAQPSEGSRVYIQVEALGFRGNGKVIRTYYTPTGVEVAIQFDREQVDLPGKLLQYKLRSHLSFQAGRRR